MRKLLLHFCLLISIICGLSSQKTYAQKAKCMDYGVGVALDPYMFNDFFRSAEPWVAIKSGPENGDTLASSYRIHNLDQFKIVNGVYNTFNATDNNGTCNRIAYWDMMIDQGKVSSTGYPVSIPLTIYAYKTKSVDPSQAADLSKAIVISAVSREIKNIPYGAPSSGWILRWKGKGKFTMDGISSVSIEKGLSKYQTLSPAGGKQFEFQSDISGGGRAQVNYLPVIHANGRVLTIELSDISDPIRDIEFVYPGTENLLDAGQAINPVFTDKIKQYKVIRYMDYMRAGSFPSRPEVSSAHPYFYSNYLKPLTWEERTKPEWYQVSSTHEYIVEISNLSKTNPWVNIPYCAGEDYVKKMTQYYMERLNPDLTVYFEVGNELWNGGWGYDDKSCSVVSTYQGADWLNQYGALNYPGIKVSPVGKGINEIFKWATAAAGPSNMDRMVRTLGAFTVAPVYTDAFATPIDRDNWDAVAMTWYFDIASGSDKCKDSLSGKNYKSLLYEYWQSNPNDQVGFNKLFRDYSLKEFRCRYDYFIKLNAALAKGYGKKLITYEGGNSTLGGASNGPTGQPLPGEIDWSPSAVYPQYWSDNGFINAIAEADKSAESAEIFNEILDSLQSAGTELVMHYGFGGVTTPFGIWNLFPQSNEKENLDYLNNKYPKFKLFNDRIKKDNCKDLFVNVPAMTIGAGLAVKLDGTNDYIQADNIKLDESGSYCIEAWVNPLLDTTSYIFGLNNSTENGNSNVLYIREDKKIIWEIKSSGNTALKLIGPDLKEKWHHVAVSKNGTRYTLYVNGKNVASTNTTIPMSSKNKFTLGALLQGTSLSQPFKGEIDELRVWNSLRTDDSIRKYMCRKIFKSALPADLKAYIKFDDGNNSVNANNLADPTKPLILKNIGFSDRSGYTISGAAIGDISKYRYESDWSNASLSFAHSDGDIVGVNNIGEGSPDGIHIYWVNEGPYFKYLPNYYDKLADNKYFGVFVANGGMPSYDLSYMYQGNPEAGTGILEDKHRLLKREDASVSDWLHSGAKLDKVAHRLNLLCKENSRAEYELGFRTSNRVLRPGSGMALKLDTLYKSGDALGMATITSQTLPDFSDYTVTFWAKGSGYMVNLYSTSGVREQGTPDNPGNQLNTENIFLDDYVDLGVRYNGFNPDVMNSNGLTGDLNHWYHYTVTRKGTHLTIYVNGIKVGEKDFILTALYNTVQIMSPPNWQNQFHATIDEFTLWNTALDQKTIRDWMCKKITNEHPYSCKNLLLYFNFDEGKGNVLEDINGAGDIKIIPGYYTYVSSGAAIGDVSAYDYENPEDISFSTSQGDFLEAKLVSSQAKGIHLYRVDNMNPVSSKVNDASILSMDSTRYWGMYATYDHNYNVFPEPLYSIIYHYQGNSSVQDEASLRLLDRYDNAIALWSNPTTQTVDNTANTILIPSQSRGEYILGGEKTTTFIFKMPDAPVFLAESPILNSKIICGNSKLVVFKVKKDPLAVSYNWTLPAELDGSSTSDSIVLNTSYLGSIPKDVQISVEALNKFGKSSKTVYNITINPEPTIADAGPDQILLPPATSVMMDGNIVASGETGTWSVAKGAGTFGSKNDPKTNVDLVSSGNNIYLWTIKQNTGTCSGSSDSVKIIAAPAPVNITMQDGSMLSNYFCAAAIITVKAIPAEGTSPIGYSWELPQGMTLLNAKAGIALIQIAEGGVGGNIKVKALYGNSNIASPAYQSAVISIRSQPNKPVFKEQPGLCLNIPITLSALTDVTASSYEWMLPDGIIPMDYPRSTSAEINVRPTKINSGYIKLQAFNDGCTNPQAIDSFYVDVKNAPGKPTVYLAGTGSLGYSLYCTDGSLYSIVNPNPNLEYVWDWDNRLAGNLEYFNAPNNTAALFNRSSKTYPAELYTAVTISVYALDKSSQSCNVSEKFNIISAATFHKGDRPDSIVVTNPLGQALNNLQVGQTYMLRTSCSTCNDSIDAFNGQKIWQHNYYWDVPKGVTILDDGSPYDSIIKIKVNGPVAGPIRTWAVTLQGCVGNADSLDISTPDGIAAPTYVSGNTNICAGTTLNITVKNVGAEEYIWQLPNGSAPINTSIPVLNIMISAGMTGDIIVKARKGALYSSAVKIHVLVKSVDLPPVTFYDKNKMPMASYEVCLNMTNDEVYIKDIYAKEYVWSIDYPRYILQFNSFVGNYDKNGNGKIDTLNPNDGNNEYQILSPNTTGRDTTNSFTNPYSHTQNPTGKGNGYIYVLSKNGCGGQNRTDSLPYEIAISPQVQQPSFIEAPTQVCVGSRITYKLKPLKSVYQYVWILSSGFSAPELTTTEPQITVDVSSGASGKIGVYAISKVCEGGKTPSQYTEKITIQGSPIDFKFENPPLAGCMGDSLTFKVTDVGASKYTWQIPGGLGSMIIDDMDPNVRATKGSINPNTSWQDYWYDEPVQGIINNQDKVTFNWLASDDTLIYTFNVTKSGTYKVYLSYNYVQSGASTAVPIEVYSKDGMKKQFINQADGPSDGIYQYLGDFDFVTGEQGMVKVYTYQNYAYVRADAIKLVPAGVETKVPSVTFAVGAKESGSVCVTIPQNGCPAGYTICTDINLNEELKNPSFTVQANSVCEGKIYKYTVGDIGASSYTWLLPNGWKIGNQSGKVKGLGRTIEVTPGPSTGDTVNIGVYGELECNGKKSLTVYTKAINYSNACKLSQPVFVLQPINICVGATVVYSVNIIPGAQSYEWTLPTGISQSGTDFSGTVVTTVNNISVVGNIQGTKGNIKVKAKSATISDSDLASSVEITVGSGSGAGRDTTVSICDNTTVVSLITLLPGKPDVSGTWIDVDQSNALSNGNFDLSNAQGKSYHFAYVLSSTGCGADTAMLTVHVGQKLLSTISASGNTTFCEGDSVKLTSGAITGNQWYKDGVAIAKAVDQNYFARLTGNYNVVFKDSGCPSDSMGKAIAVVVNPKPDGLIAVIGSTNFCPGDSVQFTSHYTDGNQWYKDGNPLGISSSELIIKTAGYYNLIVTQGTCSSDSMGNGKSVQISVKPSSNISASGPLTFCEGNSVTLISPSDTGNQWYKDGKVLLGETSRNYIASSTGNYNLIFSLNSGCISDSSGEARFVNLNKKPIAIIIADTIGFCDGKSVTLNSSFSNGNQWYKDGQLLQKDTLQSYQAKVSGYYNLIVSQNNCSSDSTGKGKKITEFAVNTTRMVSTSDVCPGVDAKVVIGSSEKGVNYNVIVNNNSTGNIAGTGADLVIPILYKSLTQAKNLVRVEATIGSCAAVALDKNPTISVTQVILDLPVIGGNVCYNEDGIVKISNSQAGVFYEPFINNVSAGPALESLGGEMALTIHKDFLNLNGNTVNIKASGFGCPVQPLTQIANINRNFPIQKPGLISGPSEICKGDEAVYSIPTVSGKTYVWSFPPHAEEIDYVNKDSIELMVKIQFKDSITGKSYVTVKVQEGVCFSDTTRLEIKTKPNCGEIFIPNIITPNANDNTAWVITGLQNHPNAEIKIMNRWGSLVFESKGYQRAWDGSSTHHESLPTGTYYYIIDLKDKNSGARTTVYNGSVTIMR